jgi:trimeric autotransporter adhesin
MKTSLSLAGRRHGNMSDNFSVGSFAKANKFCPSKTSLLCFALLVATGALHAAPWSYRGTLTDGGKPANGPYDLRVTLLNEGKTASVSSPITLYAVHVVGGNFAVEVDFAIDLNNAPAMALKTEVQQGSGGFVSLGEPSYFDAKAALAGICWDTEGNAGINAASNFLGTTDANPLLLRANNFRIANFMSNGTVANYGDAPSIALGSSANIANAIGATVGGGGSTRTSAGVPDATARNSATALFSTVGGGSGNRARDNFSTVGGGQGNTANASATVSGGTVNNAAGSNGSISGGTGNTASGQGSTVSGGMGNCAGGDYSWAGGINVTVRVGNEVDDVACGPNSGDADGDNGTFAWADSQPTNFVSTGANQFLVRAAGGMAINTNTPTPNSALTVNGRMSFGAQTTQMLNLFDASYGIGVQSSRLYFRTNNGFSWFEGGLHSDTTDNPGTGGTLRMRLSNTGQLQTTTGTISTLSDARLKDHIQDYTHALDQINALRPVRYHYRDAGTAAFQAEGMHLGFVAQEVQHVFPQWVSAGDDGNLMLSMRGFEAVAVRALQELDAENTELRARLAVIEARLDVRE